MSGRLWRLSVPDRAIRGGYVSFGEDWAELVRSRGYGPAAASLLGQALLAMPLLSMHLKTRAKISLQVSQAGPLQLLTVQGSTEGAVRGMIKTSAEALDPAALKGQLVVTLEPVNSQQRFQGIVALEGEGLSQWLARYFEQSEQVETRLVLCADQHQAAGFMLQAMPGEQGDKDWMQAVDDILVDMLPAEPTEVLSIMLGMDLQVSEEVQDVDIRCQCDATSVAQMLRGLGRSELESLLEEQGQVSVECGFCGQDYHYGQTQIDEIFAADSTSRTVN